MQARPALPGSAASAARCCATASCGERRGPLASESPVSPRTRNSNRSGSGGEGSASACDNAPSPPTVHRAIRSRSAAVRSQLSTAKRLTLVEIGRDQAEGPSGIRSRGTAPQRLTLNPKPLSDSPPAGNRLPDEQEDDGADESDEDTGDVDTIDAATAEKREHPTADDRADDANSHGGDKAARLRARRSQLCQPSGDQPKNDPGKYTHVPSS